MKSVRPLLGTYVVIEVDDSAPLLARSAVEAAFAAIETVHKRMSAFDPESDVSKINHLAHLEPVRVHPWTIDVLKLAVQIHTDSGGLFDVGIAPTLAEWQMLPPSTQTYPHSSLSNLCIEGDTVRCTVPTRIDLGGIAKGYAVDRAIEAALDMGVRSALVNAGGDLRVAGDIEEPIYLRNPGQPDRTVWAGTLMDGAIATSGIYFSKRVHDGASVSAIVEPATQQPLQCHASYSVIAPHCAVSDALTKVLALSRDQKHPAFSRHHAQALVFSEPFLHHE